MEFENLLTLMKTMSESELTEFSYEENGVQIMMSKLSERRADAVTGSDPAAKVNAAVSVTDDGVSQMAANTVSASAVSAAAAGVTSAAAQTAPAQNAAKASDETAGNVVTSPLVGVFYAAPAEDAAPYVAVGDKVTKGQTLAIVEAMKLMNEIESDYTGTIAEVLVENGQAVEYGQPLFKIV